MFVMALANHRTGCWRLRMAPRLPKHPRTARCATNTKYGGIISNCPCPTGVGVGDGLGVGHGVGVRVGVAVGDGVAVGVEGGDGVAVGVEVGDGDGDGEAGTARTLKPFESLDGLYWAVPAKFALSVTVPAPPAVI
jgi:hypothetical protein